MQPPGRQRQDDLHRHILAAAESSTDGWIAHHDLLLRQAQRGRNLLAVLVRPLAGHVDHDAAQLVHRSDAGFRLQVGVLLRACAVGVLDDDVRLGESCIQFTAADVVFEQHVAVAIGVNQRAIGLTCLQRIVHDRQVFPIDLDQAQGCGGLGFGLGHGHGDLIPDETHDIGITHAFRRAGAAQHRLIGHIQPVDIVGHVGRSEHAHHTRRGLGLGGVDAPDARVRPLGEEHLHVQHAWPIDIAGVKCLAGYLVFGINSGKRTTNCAHSYLV